MAIASTGTPAIAHGTGGTVTGTWPNGTPVTGHYLLAAVSSGAATKVTEITEGSGLWAQICISSGAGPTLCEVAWFGKVAASEGATGPVFSSTQTGTAGGMSAVVFDFTGVNTADPVDVMGANANYSSGSVTGLSVVTSGSVAASGEYALLATVMERAAGTNTWTAPTSWANAANDGTTSTRSHLAVDVYATPSSGSALTASGWSWSTHSSAYYCAALIVLNPAGSAASTCVYARLAPVSGVVPCDLGVELKVSVLTGATEAGGNSVGTSATAAPESSFTPTYSHSFVTYAATCFNATAATAEPSTTLDYNQTDSSPGIALYGGYYSGTTAAGTPVAMGASAPTGDAVSWALYEVPPAVAGTTPSRDASTPAAAYGATATFACSARFTPPAGAVLVAVFSADTSGSSATTATAVTIYDNNGLTWTKRALGAFYSNGAAAIYTATVPASGTLIALPDSGGAADALTSTAAAALTKARRSR